MRKKDITLREFIQVYVTTQGSGGYGERPATRAKRLAEAIYGQPEVLDALREHPTSGAAGTNVIILGTNLTGATAVRFNGTAAKFKVVSASEITTSVPVGATSGTVTVTTAGGKKLKSRVRFQVP